MGSSSSSSVRKVLAFALIAITGLALAGCPGGKSSNSLDGIYHAASGGPVTITIKSGKATVEIGGESQTLDYKVEDKKLTILNPKEGDVVFTINDDGTLTGQLGMMTKAKA